RFSRDWSSDVCSSDLVDLLVLLPRGSRFTGALIGAATAIKLVPGVFILYLFATRRWRAGAVSAGTFVLASGLAAAPAPRESWVRSEERRVGKECGARS